MIRPSKELRSFFGEISKVVTTLPFEVSILVLLTGIWQLS